MKKNIFLFAFLILSVTAIKKIYCMQQNNNQNETLERESGSKKITTQFESISENVFLNSIFPYLLLDELIKLRKINKKFNKMVTLYVEDENFENTFVMQITIVEQPPSKKATKSYKEYIKKNKGMIIKKIKSFTKEKIIKAIKTVTKKSIIEEKNENNIAITMEKIKSTTTEEDLDLLIKSIPPTNIKHPIDYSQKENLLPLMVYDIVKDHKFKNYFYNYKNKHLFIKKLNNLKNKKRKITIDFPHSSQSTI